MLAYRRLAFNAHKGNKEQGWRVLEQALEDSDFKDPVIHFYISKFAALNYFHEKEGIEHLLEFLKLRSQESPWKVSDYAVYYYLSICYEEEGNKREALAFAQKALMEQPSSKEAGALKARIEEEH